MQPEAKLQSNGPSVQGRKDQVQTTEIPMGECLQFGQAYWKEAKKDGMRPLCRGTQVTGGEWARDSAGATETGEEVGWGLWTKGPRQLEKRAPREGLFSHTHSHALTPQPCCFFSQPCSLLLV